MARIEGYCSFPDRLDPDGEEEFSIVIDERSKGRVLLEAIIHEFIHAENPTLPEEVVRRTAYFISVVLWDLGYRKKP